MVLTVHSFHGHAFGVNDEPPKCFTKPSHQETNAGRELPERVTSFPFHAHIAKPPVFGYKLLHGPCWTEDKALLTRLSRQISLQPSQKDSLCGATILPDQETLYPNSIIGTAIALFDDVAWTYGLGHPLDINGHRALLVG